MITSPAWSGKRYAVLGLARSGRATVEALLASGAEVLVWDDRAEAREPFLGRTAVADPLEADLTGYAGVVVSPGVPLNTHPIAGHAAKYAVPVIGDIELFAQARRKLPRSRVVGITGTNGKSTTTALTHHIFKCAGVPTAMGGNIGLPILEQDPLPKGGVYVLELSSYQLDLTFSRFLDLAVILNITPDHLDRYESFEAYSRAKERIRHLSFANIDMRRFEDHTTLKQELWPSLQGPHNLQNASAASSICGWFGVKPSGLERGLRTYPGLPHRMERVAEFGGVTWINDSKGTNTAATAPALAAFGNIHWIVGGLAKEPGLGECVAELGHVKAAYTIGKSGEDFARLLENRVPTIRSHTLAQAVQQAAQTAQRGDTVLLSPACASFDQFRDFEHRGEVFRAAVQKLQGAAA